MEVKRGATTESSKVMTKSKKKKIELKLVASFTALPGDASRSERQRLSTSLNVTDIVTSLKEPLQVT